MSITLMASVWEREELDPYERLVMLSLADHANDEGLCYPSISRLCKRTGMGERGVQKVLGRLVEKGFVSVSQSAGRRGANLYTVHSTPAPGAPPHPMHPAPSAPPPRTGCGGTPAPGAPEPSLNLQRTKTRASGKRSGAAAEAVRDDRRAMLDASPAELRAMVDAGRCTESEARWALRMQGRHDDLPPSQREAPARGDPAARAGPSDGVTYAGRHSAGFQPVQMKSMG